jgi:threonine dehydrogenase-like Zn-dependent dehydrogenase
MTDQTMTDAIAFWIDAAGDGVLRTETLPPPGPDQTLITTLATGISRGTEALVFAGKVPPSQFETMRAPLMGGAFPFPVKYGYSAVGLDPSGHRLFVLHPHQDRFIAPTAMCIPVPDDVPTNRAVLAANMETALNICWDAGCLPGERVTVIGAGVVGLLVGSLLARIPGTKVTMVDINPSRAGVAARLGCDFDSSRLDQDLVIHASGTESGLRLALNCAAFESRIIEASWFGDALPALPLGGAFHSKRLRIIASQVGHIAPAMRGRRTPAQRLALALELLKDERYDTLLEPPTDFADLPGAMPRLLAGGLCHVITYGTDACSA